MVTCMRALMGVARCIYGNCFVGKYFVVCFSTTKTTKILPPEKYPLYGHLLLLGFAGRIFVQTEKINGGDRSRSNSMCMRSSACSVIGKTAMISGPGTHLSVPVQSGVALSRPRFVSLL